MEKYLGRETRPLQTLGQIVGYLKYQSTKYVNILCNQPGSKIWQRGYHERIIRNDDEYARICEYIHCNPENRCEDEENPDRWK